VPEPTATNVIDLMAALRRSIAESEDQQPVASAFTPAGKPASSAKAPASPKPRRRRTS
jgi:non-homologous end joining protein Ku